MGLGYRVGEGCEKFAETVLIAGQLRIIRWVMGTTIDLRKLLRTLGKRLGLSLP